MKTKITVLILPCLFILSCGKTKKAKNEVPEMNEKNIDSFEIVNNETLMSDKN